MLKKIILKIYLAYCVLNFSIIMTLSVPLIVLPLLILGEKRGGPIAYFFLKCWGFLFGFFSGIRFKTINKSSIPRKQPFVYVCNHNSYLDSPAFVLAIPGQFRPLGKLEMKKIPIFGIIYPYVVIMVDRNSLESKKKSMLQLKEKLRNGISIFIFPEGKMNRSSDTLLPFHDGAFRIAIETQTSVMPMVILNSRKLMPRDEFQPHPGIITTKFLKPIATTGMNLRDLPMLKQKVEQIMRDAIEQENSAKTENL